MPFHIDDIHREHFAFPLPGSTILIYGLKNTGGKINTRNVGSHGGIDNIEVSRSTAKIYETWIEQNFLEDVLSVRTGLYDFNAEFYVTETGGADSETIETQIELTYRNNPFLWLGVQTDLQYTHNPATIQCLIILGLVDLWDTEQA